MSPKAKHYNLACIAIIREQESKEPRYLMLNTDTKDVILMDKYEVQREIEKVFNLIDITEEGDNDILFKHTYPIKIFHTKNLNNINFIYSNNHEDSIVKVKFISELDTYAMNTSYRCMVEVVLDDNINTHNPVYNYIMTTVNNSILTVEMLYCKEKEFSCRAGAKVNIIKVNNIDDINTDIDKINNKRTVLNMENIELKYVTSKITGKSILYKFRTDDKNFGVIKLPGSLYTISYDLIYSLITDFITPYGKAPKAQIIIKKEQFDRLKEQMRLVGSVYSSYRVVRDGLDMLVKDGIVLVK